MYACIYIYDWVENGEQAVPRPLQGVAALLSGARLQVHHQVLPTRGGTRRGVHDGTAGSGQDRPLQLGDALYPPAVDVSAVSHSFRYLLTGQHAGHGHHH